MQPHKKRRSVLAQNAKKKTRQHAQKQKRNVVSPAVARKQVP
jgi:heme exporter protein D